MLVPGRLYLASRLSQKASSRCGLVRHLVRPLLGHGSPGRLQDFVMLRSLPVVPTPKAWGKATTVDEAIAG